ncbi:hypothetical protein HBNCFIEN_01671 [Legionella sp. PC997]|nr:hypothetical protein HBNCFIEN_01671 [Legionella sp. PC997]
MDTHILAKSLFAASRRLYPLVVFAFVEQLF